METTPAWTWPEDLRSPPDTEGSDADVQAASQLTGEHWHQWREQWNESSEDENHEPIPADFVDDHDPAAETPAGSSSRRYYAPRTCRICLETVQPTYHPSPLNLPSMLQAHSRPYVTYESTDPELGRLMRPCKCKGSSRYVHEGCLQSWRHADPSYGRRNFWQCPTCGFQYRLERIRLSKWISSTLAQALLTALIMFLAVFLLGFVADPIINIYVDPYHTITSADFWHPNIIEEELEVDGSATWLRHLLKGLASLGVLSFLKVVLAMSPWHWYNMRNTGLVGGTRGRTGGRERVVQISWFVVLVGVLTLIWAVFKAVRIWTRRTLEKAGERVMDVHLDGDEEDEDEDEAVVQETPAPEPT